MFLLYICWPNFGVVFGTWTFCKMDLRFGAEKEGGQSYMLVNRSFSISSLASESDMLTTTLRKWLGWISRPFLFLVFVLGCMTKITVCNFEHKYYCYIAIDESLFSVQRVACFQSSIYQPSFPPRLFWALSAYWSYFCHHFSHLSWFGLWSCNG